MDDSDYDAVVEKLDGRYDAYGNFVKNASKFGFFLQKYAEKKRPRPYAVHITLSSWNMDADPQRDDLYDCLDKVNIPIDRVRGVEKCGKRTFLVDFYDTNWKRLAVNNITKNFSSKYRVYALVQDTIRITVGSLPHEVTDTEMIKFLREFGDVSPDVADVIYKEDSRKRSTFERVYFAKNLEYDIPSYAPVYGYLLSFRYKDQPHTCRLCYERDHRAFQCPLNVRIPDGALPSDFGLDGEQSKPSRKFQDAVFSDHGSDHISLRPNGGNEVTSTPGAENIPKIPCKESGKTR